jgi:hypothetical protein
MVTKLMGTNDGAATPQSKEQGIKYQRRPDWSWCRRNTSYLGLTRVKPIPLLRRFAEEEVTVLIDKDRRSVRAETRQTRSMKQEARVIQETREDGLATRSSRGIGRGVW